MLKLLSLLPVAFCSAAALADTSAPVISGTIVNAWTQADRTVASEMAKAQAATEQWLKEMTLFYVYDLGVTRLELSEIEASREKIGIEIQKIVAIKSKTPDELSDKDFAAKV